jgi:hypothetical protein
MSREELDLFPCFCSLWLYFLALIDFLAHFDPQRRDSESLSRFALAAQALATLLERISIRAGRDCSL